jgi:hypothetical protein
MSWFDILKIKFEFKPDSSEGAKYDRDTGEVSVNLANKDAIESINMDEEDFIEQLTDTLTEEYTHMAIDPEITETWKEWMEGSGSDGLTPEEMVGYAHTMHEIGANAARGYSQLGSWLMVVGHANIPLKYRQWVLDEKLKNNIPNNVENAVMDMYNLLLDAEKANPEKVKQLIGTSVNNIHLNTLMGLIDSKFEGVLDSVLV